MIKREINGNRTEGEALRLIRGKETKLTCVADVEVEGLKRF